MLSLTFLDIQNYPQDLCNNKIILNLLQQVYFETFMCPQFLQLIHVCVCHQLIYSKVSLIHEPR